LAWISSFWISSLDRILFATLSSDELRFSKILSGKTQCPLSYPTTGKRDTNTYNHTKNDPTVENYSRVILPPKSSFQRTSFSRIPLSRVWSWLRKNA